MASSQNLTADIRTAVLFQRFGPYHHARLNAAGELLPIFGLETCGMEQTYAWSKVEGAAGFTRITLAENWGDSRSWKQELHRKIWRTLADIKPRVVVVPGWSSIDALSALKWCARTGTPAVVMSESTEWDEPRVAWREWIKRRLVGLFSAALVGGKPHADYIQQLGVSSARIFLGYDAVDNDYFAANADKIRNQASATRARLGLPASYFLASARFILKKNLPLLVRAYAQYRNTIAASLPQSEPWKLVLLGDGPLKPELVRLIAELSLRDSVLLPGFKQYEELPAYYALAGAFVHASTVEQWGLVVNEAMASGMPVLVSNRCGCASDLIHEGGNGFTFDPADEAALARLMVELATHPEKLSSMGNASRKLISKWGPDRFASGISQAVTAAVSSPAPKAGLLDRALLTLLLQR